MRIAAALATALSLTASATALPAATGCAADAILVFDGSASMDELVSDIRARTRIEDARQAMRDAMPDITPYRRVGLLVYGPGPLDACSDIDLRFGPAPDAAQAIIGAVDDLRPSGMTPLTESVRRAAEALNYRTTPGIVVLVTDGNETCGGRPCALGEDLARQAADLTVHVIGFKVVVDFFSWDNPEQQDFAPGVTVARCLADRTGGLFVSTETVDELADALRATLGCALIGENGVPARRKART
jgi:Ca-activated chloride channel family protein